jgi:hypothetical protein
MTRPFPKPLENLTTAEAYDLGRNLLGMNGDTLADTPADLIDARRFARSWREALKDHAHTSYYGTQLTANRAAYWLGVCRGLRKENA